MCDDKLNKEKYVKEFNNKESEALEHALDIRKFEIELYWKRATYFWAFIGITFAGYLSVLNTKSPISDKISIILACLGFIFSLAWTLANRGSKKWQENWEHHVDLLEDKVIGPLYKVVLSKGKPENKKQKVSYVLTGSSSFSVSKINQLISLYISIIWLFLLYFSLPNFYVCSGSIQEMLDCIDLSTTFIIVISFVFCILLFVFGKSHDNHNFKLSAHLRRSQIDS